MEPVVLPLFSKVVYVKVTNIDCASVVKKLKEKMVQSGEKTDVIKNLSLSSYDKNVLERKKFKSLKDKIMEELYEYTKNVLKYSNDFKMTTSWFTEANKNQESNYHNHNNCMISGCLYLNVNKDTGGINFNNFDNYRFQLESNECNVYNSRDFTINPKNGTIIFFPSEVYHKILKNNSNMKRISLAFNFIPIGKIGYNGDSQLEI
jgi:uncharacterized protein (TIGR02466 family)